MSLKPKDLHFENDFLLIILYEPHMLLKLNGQKKKNLIPWQDRQPATLWLLVHSDSADNVAVNSISRNLLTIYRKYCILIGYRTHYLSGDR